VARQKCVGAGEQTACGCGRPQVAPTSQRGRLLHWKNESLKQSLVTPFPAGGEGGWGLGSSAAQVWHTVEQREYQCRVGYDGAQDLRIAPE
jgi:hypothetical protein